MMNPAIILVFLSTFTAGIRRAETAAHSQQLFKRSSANELENECSLTKTVFELNAELKISLFKLETWKEEIDRQLENLKSVEKTIKLSIDDLSTRLEKQSKEMRVIDTKLTSDINLLRENLEEDIREGDRSIKADITELLQNQSISTETKTQNVKMNLESQIVDLKDEFRNDVKNVSAAVMTELVSLPQTISAIVRNHSTGGATYVRWASTTCGENSSLIYSGVVGGGRWDHTGSAVNSLCLPKDPELKVNVGGSVTYIYGAKYKLGRSHNYAIPCAVCDTGFKTKVFMLPAKSSCPKGWNTEYSGMLVAGYYDHKASTEYNCFDKSREHIPYSSSNADGKLFYYVRASCGSLSCPPYPRSTQLTCAVCSG